MSYTEINQSEPKNKRQIIFIIIFLLAAIFFIGKAFAASPDCYMSGYHTRVVTDYKRFDDLNEALAFMLKYKGELYTNRDADDKPMGWVVGYPVYHLFSNNVGCDEL